MPENKLPSYEELFGNLDYSVADEYRSVLSPAAYLTDIMDLKNWKYDHGIVVEKDAVDDRRSDISEILLNAENTITEIPHLDVVNQIMENRVAAIHSGSDPYNTLKTSKFPFNLPFNKDKTEIKYLLEYFKTDAMRFYKQFKPYPQINIEARESLGLGEEEYSVIVTAVSETTLLQNYYGIINNETLKETFADLFGVSRFRKATELSALQLTELFFQNLSDKEKDIGVSKKFFINSSSSVGGYLVTVTDVSTKKENIFVRITSTGGTTSDIAPPPDYFDRINRFIRLSRKLGISFADLDLILIKGCGGVLDENALQIIAAITWLQKTYEISIEEICTFFSAIKDYGQGQNTIPEDLYNKTFNNGYDKSISDVTGASLKNRVQAGLACAEPEYNAIEKYMQGVGKNIEPNPSRLALAYRIKKLSSILELSVESLFILFRLIDKNHLLIDWIKFPLPIGFLQSIANSRDIITIEEASGSVAVNNTKNILSLVQLTAVMMQWLNEHEMTVEQLEFICTEYSSSAVEDIPSNEETVDLFRELNGQFRSELFTADLLLSGVTDRLTAELLIESIADLEKGVLTSSGIVRGATTAEQLLPFYLDAIKEILIIEAADLIKTGLSLEALADLLLVLQGSNFIDLDGYISNNDSNILFFSEPTNVENFLPDTNRATSVIVFKEISERVKNYSRTRDAAESECASIAERISVQAGRQQSILFGSLAGTLNLSPDIVKILCITLFRTADESEQMATVRFMSPVMEAFDRVEMGSELVFDASLLTSFRRLLQFSLLVSKTDLRARELEVLFYIKDVQKSLPEKLKLPAPFSQKIDAMVSDAKGNIYIFSGNQYIRFSGRDYSFEAKGSISELTNVPALFHSGINAAVRSWAPNEQERKSYYFSGDKFSNTAAPDKVVNTVTYWGKVRNHIAELNRVDAAYKAGDGKVYLFSDDQYVRYSSTSKEYVDEGYPKNTLKNWNKENQIQLPIDIRKKVDSIFLDSDGKTYFFSGDKFVDSSNASSVQRTKLRWAQVINNIVDNNHVDSVLAKDGVTFMFSGNQYTRYSNANYAYTDEGYPKKIANNWNKEGVINVAGEYSLRVDAAFKGSDNQIYLFNGNTFISSSKVAPPSVVNEKWAKVLNNIELNNLVDAALAKEGKTYLFSGDQYFKYSSTNYAIVDEGYPKKIARWNNMENSGTLPAAFNPGISAAFTARDNTAYFFSGNQYISSKPNAQAGQIKDVWAVVRNNIQTANSLDAGFVAPDGKSYIFSGDQFYRYSANSYVTVDEGYPKRIQDHWGALPDSFKQKIDAAFVFNVGGVDRLYLFSGNYYVRYSSGNYSKIDAGYPQKLDEKDNDEKHNPEGKWFKPIFSSGPSGHDHRKKIATIFTDQFNNKPRINFFYYDDDNRERLTQFEHKPKKDHDKEDTEYKDYYWTKPVFVSALTISPFTSVDVGFRGVDGKVYLFANKSFATLIGDFNGITKPTAINDTWGKVLNRFQDLNRVDGAFTSVNGSTYLICDTQYVRYSGPFAPGNADFYSDEAYPKTIAGNWNSENLGIVLPSVFAPQGYAVFSAPDETLYAFSKNTFISSTNSQPVSINTIWGKVENNFQALNRVDAAFVHNSRTYLFCSNQYTRYSQDYSGYADEGYPKKIAHMAASDGIDATMQFPGGIDAIETAADGSIYVFAGGKYVSSIDSTTSAAINSRFGIVRNNITDTGIIDAADVTGSGALFLFSGDQYVRYSVGSRAFVDEGYPKTIARWGQFEQGSLPATASQGIKASFTDVDGEDYFFAGTEYFSPGNPSVKALINTKWGKVRNNIQEKGIVDAAFIAPSGKLILFSVDQYAQYSPDVSTYVQGGYPNAEAKTVYLDEGFPKKIADNWGNLPDSYRAGLDAASIFDGRTYFFKDKTYIRYSDPACKIIDAGFPKEIASAMSELPEFRLNDVKAFQQFKVLSKSFNLPDKSILQYFKDSKAGLNPAAQLRLLSSITAWKEQEISFLVGSDVTSGKNIADIQVLTEMKSLFDVSSRMASLPSTLKTEIWDKIYGTPVVLNTAATILGGQLRTAMGAAAWSGLSAELRNRMNLVKRDALLGYLIFRMEQTIGTDWIKNPRDLYEYLLIDVEMGEEAVTSRIQEAIMCMQLFYHRTLMNLENVDQATMKDVKLKLQSWWIWMKNYRVWEANRKVFLYPENYIRPELRLDKSPEFKELEEKLLQGDITDETADSAYKTYLDQYSEVSRLKVAGGYTYQRAIGNPDDTSQTAGALNEKKIIMFGHSKTEPKKYYYMTGDILEESDAKTGQVIQSIDWAPWKEIGITIDADKVYPVFSFNRLFVFWVEIRERDQSSYSTSVGPDKKATQYDPVIFYSFYNLKEEWTHPQKMFDIGAHVDKLAANKQALFIDDKKKINTDSYIPAREILNGARLYVTNPITSRYYDAEEFIYVSYDVRYGAHEFTFEGKIKSDLEFEQGQVAPNLLDKLEKNIQFPFEKFGITPISFNHWKGFHNDSFTAPWFSFNAGGGSFLIKPEIVNDAPVIKSDIILYGIKWINLPDSGFTDQSNNKHLFYRNELTSGATQYYMELGGNPLPVTDVWGKRNIFEYIGDVIKSVVVNGDKLFITTTENRYISYTGSDLRFIDQDTVEATLQSFTLDQILPSGATAELWHRIKEDLRTYLDTLDRAFVYSGDNRLYLIANPVDENGQTIREYTIPDISEFFAELAALVPDNVVANLLRTWTSIRSANYYTANGSKRLYITSGDNVFVADYIAATNRIRTIAALTHPDLIATVYDPTPAGAVEKPWVDTEQSLMEFISRLTGVGNESGVIRLIAIRQDGSYEFTIPVAQALFDKIADIINDINTSPIVAALTELSAADLYVNGSINRLYLRSGNTAVIFDYVTGTWTVEAVNELIHPDVTAKIPSLSGLLPTDPAVPWSDVAEDFNEYMTTVQGALVWKGNFYLLRPKPSGGSEYASPSATTFWSTVAASLPAVSAFTAIDSACVLTENGNRQLVVTFNKHVAKYDFTSASWGLSTINQVWGIGFNKIDGVIQAADGKVYIFSGNSYAEKINNVFTAKPVVSKWGFQTNAIISMVDSAFMDGDGRVYLFSGENFFRYSDINNKVIDAGYPKNILENLGIDEEEVKEEFSADKANVEILNISTNTAFVQILPKLDTSGVEIKEEKMYLFMDITAEITTFIWRWRWRWWGGWKMKRFSIRRKVWWGWWWPEYYLEVQKEIVRKSVYMRFSRDKEIFLIDADYPRLITGNWSNLPGDFNKMITATFEDVEGTGAKRKDVFYVVRGLVENKNGKEVITNDYVKYIGKENFPKEISEERYEVIRLTSNTSEVLSQRLFIDGLDGLLSLNTQKNVELPVFKARSDSDTDSISGVEDNSLLTLKDRRKNDIVVYKQEYIRIVPTGNTLDFVSINGQYYWEIFFHAPFLIAQAFNNAQKFDEGNKWYEHIFDPTEQYDDIKKSFWKFLPFHQNIDNSQSGDLNNPVQYRRYLNDPFDPHAIAALRQIAYRKTIVMSYIDNLIDHGDMLFRQYTRETINEARMLYVLAYDLLGKKPELLGTKRLSDAKTYKQLRQDKYGLNMALIEMENLPGNALIPFQGSAVSPSGSLLDPYGYFYIPENREFADYWDRIEDRLYKIRYSLNIEGIKQKLALFEPPIDVMALVRAVGSGLGLAQALADYNVAIPHYRFVFILSKSRELTARLTQFGQSLLSALEKKDAEELALLRNTHEKAILKLTLDIKNAQLEDSRETLGSLRANLNSAQTREGYYRSLIATGLSSFEQSQLDLMASAQVLTSLSQSFSVAASIGGMLPETGPFAIHWGGHNLNALFTGISQSYNATSSTLSYSANLASILGGYHRRGQDWGLQQKLAQNDIESISRQIAGAEIKVKIAQLDIATAKTSIKNLESVDTFMKGRFTNRQLYQWMSGKLSGLYFKTYQMALDMAKIAQKSFQFELGYKESEVNFISALYWDSLKKGLLAGETLQVDLDRMDKAYIEKNKRRFEISKTVSLQQRDPLAFLNLREKRVCEFTLSEELYDYDFPGHYRRQIKTVSITFPAVAGVYENINATLTQLSHRTLIDPDKAGVEYLLSPEQGVDQPLSIRADWRTNQQIALSRGINDAGLFQLNFQDERYLPFEGTGAVSSWRLELNGQERAFDLRTLSDVLIKIEYSALQGGDVFAATVKKKLKPSPAARIFNLSQDFSAEWNRFMENPAVGLSIKVTREMFQNMGSRNKVTGLYMLYALSKEGVKAIGDTAMKLNTIDVKQATLVDLTVLGKELSISAQGSSWKLIPNTSPEQAAELFAPGNISNIALVFLTDSHAGQG